MQNLIANRKKSSSGRKTNLRVEKKKKTGSNVEEDRSFNKKTRPNILTSVKVRREMHGSGCEECWG